MQILPIKKFIEKLERNDKGIIFCQVSKDPITNHEINLDIFDNSKV